MMQRCSNIKNFSWASEITKWLRPSWGSIFEPGMSRSSPEAPLVGCREQASKPAARFARLHNRIHGFEPAIACSNMIPSACAADKVLLQGRQHLPVAGLACLQSQCAHQVDGRALLACWRTASHAPQATGNLNSEARDRLALRRKGVHVRHLLKALQTKSAESVSNRVCTSGQLQGAREDTELSFMVQEPKEILTRRAFPQAFKGSSGTLHQLWLLLNTCISFARMLGTSCAWCNTMVRNYVLKLPCCPVAWKCPAPGPEGFKQAGQVTDGLKSTRHSNAFRTSIVAEHFSKQNAFRICI